MGWLGESSTFGALVSVGFILLCVGVMAFKAIQKAHLSDIEANRNQALEISKLEWYVKGASFNSETEVWLLTQSGWMNMNKKPGLMFKNSAFITLASVGGNRKVFDLAIRPNHPSKALVRDLEFLQKIKFDFNQEPLQCCLPHEFCAYLTIREE